MKNVCAQNTQIFFQILLIHYWFNLRIWSLQVFRTHLSILLLLSRSEAVKSEYTELSKSRLKLCALTTSKEHSLKVQ